MAGGSDTVLSFAGAAILGYVVGSIPTGVLVSRLSTGADVREHGSGSPGATNVSRLLGWRAGLAVAALDAAKGFLAVRSVGIAALGAPDDPTLPLVAGFFAALGHVWPAFAGFRGGKAVATSAGALLAADPAALLATAIVFAVVLAARRIVSLASLAAAIALPPMLLGLRWAGFSHVSGALVVYAFLTAALVLFAHRSNVARLRAGTEPTLGPRLDP